MTTRDYYIIIDNNNKYCTYVKGFQCAKCLLPEAILSIDTFRYSFMAAKYLDYGKNILEYERKWKTGEISGELYNFVREIINKPAHGFIIKSLSDTTTGFMF
jgi:hypothetical protein